ncbi:hypothetical protein Nepgr_021078 [Nepenthes gracilis]|uniref:Uncharacterized protein n=1 Tax=Nepenthes gracilis TaxID=150966 RepID=A0AAD3SY82_NEPGR|nr:hypothetical protein Nepgr_021078 [Nepenthes gracilis]
MLAPLDDSGHSVSLNPRMQLDSDGAEESQHENHPNSELILNSVADDDIELTPRSIKRLSTKYSLDTLHSSVEDCCCCRGLLLDERKLAIALCPSTNPRS